MCIVMPKNSTKKETRGVSECADTRVSWMVRYQWFLLTASSTASKRSLDIRKEKIMD